MLPRPPSSPLVPYTTLFRSSTALIRGLLGPLGSGKTTTCLVGQVEAAIKAPRCLDGVRRWRVLAIRDNYRQLYKTLIPSWHDLDRKSTRLNSSHSSISYAVF